MFNGEYRIPIAGTGQHLAIRRHRYGGHTRERANCSLKHVGFSNLTTQFPGVPVNQTLQIQPGTNFKPRGSVGIEFVVQLPIINAPFRLYWAYNLLRLDQQIIAPAEHIHGSG